MEGKTPFRKSIGARLLIVGLLILVFMIPSAMISSLVSERANRKNEAIIEISSKWAQAQTIGGPVITIPYEYSYKDDDGKVKTGLRNIQVLPNRLNILGTMVPEIRYRGIYKAVLYNARLTVDGNFSFAKVNSLNISPQSIHWNEAFVSLLIPDMRGIKDYIELKWMNQSLPFEPGIRNGNNIFDSGVSVKLPLLPASTKDVIPFSLKLNLNGSEELALLPLGQQTTVSIASPWTSPSFDGAFLPEKREIGPKGFHATWRVLDLNRNYPQVWADENNKDNIFATKFGVKFFSAVSEYSMTDRAIKYLFMFVGLTFLIFFLVEVFNQKRIHPIQYLLIGLSLCIFYVLLLSISEHLSFTVAYLIASFAVTLLITAYVRSALDGKTLTIVTACLLATLYSFMYILLCNEDYALLLGSAGLFIIMAVVMYLLRKVNWYKLELDA